MSGLYILASYVALICMTGWWGVGMIIVHVAIMLACVKR